MVEQAYQGEKASIMRLHLWIFDFRTTALLSIFSGDIHLGRVHSARTSVSEAPPCGRRIGWLWVKPAVRRLQHGICWQTRQDSCRHAVNTHPTKCTLFNVAREATKRGAKNPGLGVLEAGLQSQFSQFLIPKLGLHFLYPNESVTSQGWTFSNLLIIFATVLQYE